MVMYCLVKHLILDNWYKEYMEMKKEKVLKLAFNHIVKKFEIYDGLSFQEDMKRRWLVVK